MKNLEAILEQAGSNLGQVVKVNVFVTDMGNFAEMNNAYLGVFEDPQPVRRLFTTMISDHIIRRVDANIAGSAGAHLCAGLCPAI